MNKKKRNILLGSIGGVIVLTVIIALLTYHNLFSRSLGNTETVYIYIDRDDTIDSVYYKIEQEVPAKRIKGFKLLSEKRNYDKNIRTGKYAIQPNDTPLKLYQRLSRGQQLPVKVTFNNIRTREQLAARISSQLMIDSIEIAEKLFDTEFQKSMGYQDETIISLFIPNTYEVYWNISSEEFLKRMQKEHQRFWTDERLAKAKAIGLTPEQVATVASIVEEETNYGPEKPTVAGLYINRIKKGMLLQADPTVKFAVGDFTMKRVYNRHLEIDSPYNTYKYPGLPPGPIRIPSIQGLESVLNHEKHNYIFMCAKEDFSGQHNFATTNAQHERNRQKYITALNKRKIF